MARPMWNAGTDGYIYSENGETWRWVQDKVVPRFGISVNGRITDLFRGMIREDAADAARLLLRGTCNSVELYPEQFPGHWEKVEVVNG